MKRTEMQSRMSDYLEGDVPLTERALMDAHFDRDEESARELEELRRTVELLRSLPEPEPPPELVERVMARIAAGEGRPPLWHRLWMALGRAPAQLALPAAAAAALVGVVMVSGDLRWAGISGTQVLLPADRHARPAAPTQEVVPAPPVPAVRQDAAPAPASDPLPQVRERIARELSASLFSLRPRPDELPLLGASAPPVQTPLQEAMAVASDPPGFRTPGAVLGGSRGPAEADFFRPGAPSGFDTEAQQAERAHRLLDARIDLLLADAAAFLRQMRRDSVAAQELWMAQLAERAVERNVAEQALDSLRSSGDVEALGLADVFETASERARAAVVAAEPELAR